MKPNTLSAAQNSLSNSTPELECNAATMAVFQRHVEAFRAANLDAIVRDFADDAIILTQDGVYQGKDRIRNFYRDLLREFGCIEAGDSVGILVDTVHVHGDVLCITWHAQSRHNVFDFGSDTFIIADNAILRQTVTFSPPQPSA